MPRAPKADPEQIKALEQKLAKVQRDLKRARSLQEEQERRNDTRRKAIGGALTETHALKNPGSEWSKIYIGLLKEYVLPRDRWLFDHSFRALLPAHEAASLLADVPPKPDVTEATQTAEPDMTEAAE